MRRSTAIFAALLLGTWVLHTWDIFHWQYWYHPRDDDWEFLEHAQWYATNLTPLNGQWWRLADLHDKEPPTCSRCGAPLGPGAQLAFFSAPLCYRCAIRPLSMRPRAWYNRDRMPR